jgi:hypothetical protein
MHPLPDVTVSADPPAEATRRTLMSVLPMTTAWAGAGAVVIVPTGAVLVGTIVEGSTTGLPFLLIAAPAMVSGSVAAFVFGLATGALAGLPDWWLRRRRPTMLGDGAAVLILTALVAVAWSAVCLLIPYLVPWPVATQVVAVAAMTAVSTLTVVAVHRRRERRRAALTRSPGGDA